MRGYRAIVVDRLITLLKFWVYSSHLIVTFRLPLVGCT